MLSCAIMNDDATSSDADTSDSELQVEVPLCPHCLVNVDELDHFCPECGGPITAHAAIGPLEQVYALGHGYRGAVSGQPRGIVVIGMWLIFGPTFLFLLLVLFSIVISLFSSLVGSGRSGDAVELIGDLAVASSNADSLLGLLGGFVYLCMAGLSGVLLWKVTHRYFVSSGAQVEE